MLENTSYEPDQFPGLVYNIEELGAILLVFSTGKIVCTGVKNFEDASKAIEIMKDKILSIGAL
jgi:transcription initiation factor TFIID TATA-box-binding protein